MSEAPTETSARLSQQVTEGDAIGGEIGSAGVSAAVGDNITQTVNTVNLFDPVALLKTFTRQGIADPRLESMLFQERSGIHETELRKQEINAYLSSLEDLIRRELIKAGDKHFVELSMKMAQSTDHSIVTSTVYRMAVGKSYDDQNIIRDLGELQQVLEVQPLVLLGNPGSGKSTVLQHVALRMIGNYREGKSKRLPFFVRLTDYHLIDGRAQPILEFLKSCAVALVGKEHFIAREFEELTRTNQFVFILDGLDQLPERRSETIRLKQLKRIEGELKYVNWALKIARLFRMKSLTSRLVGSQQKVAISAAPKVDPREEAIDRLPESFPLQCAVITSCRRQDFIGVPRWQTLSLLAMDEKQINEFIQQYAPGAETVINPQVKASESTRGLITNPFYLRMLTQAFKEGLKDEQHSSELKNALTKRGRLLEYLIRKGLYRHVERNEDQLKGASEKQARVDHILCRLGTLAYHMLRGNVIGSIPGEALEKILDEDRPGVINAAADGNLITINDEEGSIEFNHQLFLEFLLAFDLKHKAAQEGSFEEALKLLSRRGDRWAETIRLMFEMVDETSREMLIEKFVEALRAQDTWDISTRVLSDLGPRVAPYVAELLLDREEMTVTGAVTILGRTNAQDYAPKLAELNAADSWRVRRAAVEALAGMRLISYLSKFDADPSEAVLRAVFRARLVLDEAPDELIKTELADADNTRSEQMAYAALDVFSSLLMRLSDDAILDLLRLLVSHHDQDIRMLGFLMIGQAPERLRRRLKSELQKAALEEDDTFINVIARRALSPLLDRNDMAKIKELAPVAPNPFDFSEESKKARRAYWLLLEARETVSPLEYLNSLLHAPEAEVQLLTKKLGRRADSTSLSFLTFLLADKRTAPAAAEALAGLKEKGVAYLLDALTDPSREIRLNVAEILQFCHLPKKYARQVRKTLSEAKIRCHDVKPIQMTTSQAPETGSGKLLRELGTAALFTPLIVLFITSFYWIGGRIIGSVATFGYWLRYALWNGHDIVTVNEGAKWWLREIEVQSFGQVLAERDADFWFARGRFERALGRKVAAKDSLQRSLKLCPDSDITRLELAIMQWSLGNIGLAQETLNAEHGKYLTSGSGLDAMNRLLSIEQAASERSPYNEIERMSLLDRLELWPEAQAAALEVLKKDRTLPDPYLVLFHAYRGTKTTRRALAAAIAYNERMGEVEIRKVELEDLQWQHRSDAYPATEIGKFEIEMDLQNDGAALDVLRSLNILPADDTTMSQDHIDSARVLPAEVKAEVRDVLQRSGNLEAAKVIADLMPLDAETDWN
jgi:HEAT repeat protein